MKTYIMFLLIACSTVAQPVSTAKIQIASTLDSWHQAAAKANFETYFNMMSPDAIYIGTDATEIWNIEQFKTFSKPYFDRGKAWDFKAVDRNIYIINQDFAYFDELLVTQMKICRGSGVMRKVGNQWKIAHYVLSMTVPNDLAAEVTALKAPIEDTVLQKLHAAAKKE